MWLILVAPHFEYQAVSRTSGLILSIVGDAVFIEICELRRLWKISPLVTLAASLIRYCAVVVAIRTGRALGEAGPEAVLVGRNCDTSTNVGSWVGTSDGIVSTTSVTSAPILENRSLASFMNDEKALADAAGWVAGATVSENLFGNCQAHNVTTNPVILAAIQNAYRSRTCLGRRRMLLRTRSNIKRF